MLAYLDLVTDSDPRNSVGLAVIHQSTLLGTPTLQRKFPVRKTQQAMLRGDSRTLQPKSTLFVRAN
jgi:hypothetical protein